MVLGDLLFPNIEMKLVITHDFMSDVEAAQNRMSNEYRNATALVRLSKGDMQKLGLKGESNVSIQSKAGSVVVHAVMDENAKDGLAVVPYGPWALALVDVPPDGSPPQYHGIPVTVKRSDEQITPLLDLFQDSSSS